MDISVIAFFNVPANDGLAIALGGRAQENAGACGFTVTGFKVGTAGIPFVCHFLPPFILPLSLDLAAVVFEIF